jgi:hypothetical protein
MTRWGAALTAAQQLGIAPPNGQPQAADGHLAEPFDPRPRDIRTALNCVEWVTQHPPK